MLQDNNAWEQICEEWQERILAATPKLEFKSPRKLYSNILKCLITAKNERILKTKEHELYSLLSLQKAKPKDMQKYGKGIVEITGGQRNFDRSREIPHFERVDGCWFDFSIFINSNQKPIEIIGFDFEIRFPKEYGVTFLRFDLNPPKHLNEERGMRFHIHPGHDDFMIPSPPLSPLEILSLLLHGFPINDRPREIAK